VNVGQRANTASWTGFSWHRRAPMMIDAHVRYCDCELERAHGIVASNSILFVLFATHFLRHHTGTRSILPTTYLGSKNRITSPSPCWFSNRFLNQIKSLQAASTSHVGNEQIYLPDYYAKIAWVWSTHLGTTNVVRLRVPLSSISDVGTTDCKSNDSPVVFTQQPSFFCPELPPV
jgi:hypothetical protein